MPETRAAAAEVGTLMPELDLIDTAGRTQALHDLRAGAPALVYFLRAANCPICLRHARAIADLADQGKLADLRVVLVAPGGAEEAAKVAERVGSDRVAVRASGSGHAAAGLGVFLTMQHSGTFVLSPAGSVRYRRTGALPTNGFNAREVLALLEP